MSTQELTKMMIEIRRLREETLPQLRTGGGAPAPCPAPAPAPAPAIVPFVLIALQPDLGTASTFLPMLAGVAWVAGLRLGTAAWLAGLLDTSSEALLTERSSTPVPGTTSTRAQSGCPGRTASRRSWTAPLPGPRRRSRASGCSRYRSIPWVFTHWIFARIVADFVCTSPISEHCALVPARACPGTPGLERGYGYGFQSSPAPSQIWPAP